MVISHKSIKVLWSAAGGRCSFPDCWEKLVFFEAKEHSAYTIGEMAHICGDKPDSNRHNASQTQQQRDEYKNLILLCPTHHTLIDRKENEARYSEEVLLEIKASHEAHVLTRMDKNPHRNREQVFREILELLEENRQSWLKYGPISELAKSQPHNEAVHSVWLRERLSVIVPNNREIVAILDERNEVFRLEELEKVANFKIHARSYERWVEDEIVYAAVVRFPSAFEMMIREG